MSRASGGPVSTRLTQAYGAGGWTAFLVFDFYPLPGAPWTTWFFMAASLVISVGSSIRFCRGVCNRQKSRFQFLMETHMSVTISDKVEVLEHDDGRVVIGMERATGFNKRYVDRAAVFLAPNSWHTHVKVEHEDRENGKVEGVGMCIR